MLRNEKRSASFLDILLNIHDTSSCGAYLFFILLETYSSKRNHPIVLWAISMNEEARETRCCVRLVASFRLISVLKSGSKLIKSRKIDALMTFLTKRDAWIALELELQSVRAPKRGHFCRGLGVSFSCQEEEVLRHDAYILCTELTCRD